MCSENGDNKMKRGKGAGKESENESPCYPDRMIDDLKKYENELE